MSHRKLSDDILLPLIEALENITTVTALSLSSNWDLTDKLGDAVLRLLEKNDVIQKIDLNRTDLSKDKKKRVELFLDINKVGYH